MIQFKKADTTHIPLIQQLSREIWHAVYPSIVSVGQIEYMLEMMYSDKALLEQMTQKGHLFMLLEWMGDAAGFVSFSVNNPDAPYRYRIHKLYVLPSLHGKGLGKAAVEHVANAVRALGGTSIELNVNKKNPAVAFYERIGFYREREEVVDIGQGYLMDDYIMALELNGA
jgi:diamine N-acetyltransferase